MVTHPVPHPDLAGYLLGVLDPGQAQAFQTHLAGCASCRREIDELRGLPALLATAGAAVQVPANLRARTFARIHAADHSDAAARTAGPPRRDGTEPGSGSPRPGRGPGPGHPPSGRRRRLLVAVAAAAALIVIVPGGATLLGVGAPEDTAGHGSTGVPPTDEVSTAATSAAGGAGSTGSAGGGAADGTTLTLSTPDTGPQHGVATVWDGPAGLTVELDVQGLPPPIPGHRYVCWFVGPGDSPVQPNRVAAGSFTTDDAGQADVSMTGVANPQRFPLLDVTLEPNDGNLQRRGPVVLITK